MKLFSITLNPLAEEIISISSGANIKKFDLNKRSAVGIDLGYFTPRTSDTEGTPLNAKYFKVDNAEGTAVEHVTLKQVEGKHIQYGVAVTEDEDTDILVYLNVFDAETRARFLNGVQYREENRLIEGRYFTNNVVYLRTPGVRVPTFCCPSLLVCHPNDTFQVSYKNTNTDQYRIATLKYENDNVVLVSDEEKPHVPNIKRERKSEDPKFKKSNRIHRPKEMSAFGESLANTLADNPDFTLKKFEKPNKRPGYRNDRARKRELDRKHRRDDY